MPILIADDDHDTVTTEALLFQRSGFSVMACEEGKDVMPLVEEYKPSVLLLDLSMPGMNGFDIAQELKDNPDLRPKLLVAVTGYADSETRQKTAAAGFDYHFAKPVEFSTLLQVVAQALGRDEGDR
jgi:CheY-like chemotaxis protein